MTTLFTFKWDEEEDSGPEDMVQQLSFLGAYDVEYEEVEEKPSEPYRHLEEFFGRGGHGPRKKKDL